MTGSPTTSPAGLGDGLLPDPQPMPDGVQPPDYGHDPYDSRGDGLDPDGATAQA